MPMNVIVYLYSFDEINKLLWAFYKNRYSLKYKRIYPEQPDAINYYMTPICGAGTRSLIVVDQKFIRRE